MGSKNLRAKVHLYVNNARDKYPNLNFKIDDFDLLKQDLENAVKKGTEAINREDKFEKRKFTGFDYEYICNYIQGYLNASWHNEYIHKQTNNYKLFAAVNALDSFLKFDELLKIRLSRLYSDYYQSQINLEGIDSKIKMDLPENLNFLDIENSDNQILVALENIKVDLIKKNFYEEIPDFLTSVTENFTRQEIIEILK